MIKNKYIIYIFLSVAFLISLFCLEPPAQGPQPVNQKLIQNEYAPAMKIVNELSNLEIISYNIEDLVRTIQKPARVSGFTVMGTFSGRVKGGGAESQKYGIKHNVHLICKDTNDEYYITLEEYSGDEYYATTYDCTSLTIKKGNVVVFRTPSVLANYNQYRRDHFEWEVKEGQALTERTIFKMIKDKAEIKNTQ